VEGGEREVVGRRDSAVPGVAAVAAVEAVAEEGIGVAATGAAGIVAGMRRQANS